MKTTEENNQLLAEFKSLGYSLDKQGVVFGKNGKPLRLHKGASGYIQVNFYRNGQQKTLTLHRLLALSFIENPDNKAEVNHIDGDKLNNDLSNLEWCTRSENIIHGIRIGLFPKKRMNSRGKKHWRSKPVYQYLNGVFISEFESSGDASRKTGFHAASIQDACKGKLKTYRGFKWYNKNK